MTELPTISRSYTASPFPFDTSLIFTSEHEPDDTDSKEPVVPSHTGPKCVPVWLTIPKESSPDGWAGGVEQRRASKIVH